MDRSELANRLESDAAFWDGRTARTFTDDLRAAASIIRSTAWRPISEAPRDGTRILALWGSIVVDGREYKPDITTTKCHDGEWVSLDSNDYMYGEPDAWMPLPPPPSEGVDG
jgi:hypothetical protein